MKYLKYLLILISVNVYAQRRAFPITPLILSDTLAAKSGDMVVHEDSSKFLLPVWIGGGLVYDVRVYGAKCDGTTNDVAAVQVAIDSANATGGGIVFFPEGTTLVGSTLAWYSNVSGMGIGHGSILKCSAADTLIRIVGTESSTDSSAITATADSAQADIEVHDGTKFSADDIVVIINEDPITQNISFFDSLGLSHIEWNRVSSVDADTITLVHELRNTFDNLNNGYMAVLTPMKGIHFSNMTFQGTGDDGGDCFDITYGEDILIENCKFVDVARNRIRWSKGIKFEKCYFEDIFTAMDVRHSERCFFVNCETNNVEQNVGVFNHSDYFNMTGNHTRNSVYGTFHSYYADYSNISHNFFENTAQYGVLLDNGARYTKIKDNHFHNTLSSTAIQLTGPIPTDSLNLMTGFIVTGNTIRNAAQSAIVIEVCSQNIVKNNIIMYCGSTVNHHAIVLQANANSYCDYNIISNNQLYDVTGVGISWVGTGLFRGNIITENIIADSYRGIFTSTANFSETVIKGNIIRNISGTSIANLDSTAIGDFTVISSLFDLSGAAGTEVVFVPVQDCYILSCVLVYEEATSADAGVALKVGTSANDDRFFSITSHVSQSAYAVRNDAGTISNRTALKGIPVVVSNAGSKTGTGTVYFMLNITNLGVE